MAIQNIEKRAENDKEFLELYCDSSADITDLPTTGVVIGSYAVVNGDGVYIFDGTAWTKLAF